MKFSTFLPGTAIGALVLALALPATARAIPPQASLDRRDDAASLSASPGVVDDSVLRRDVPVVQVPDVSPQLAKRVLVRSGGRHGPKVLDYNVPPNKNGAPRTTMNKMKIDWVSNEGTTAPKTMIQDAYKQATKSTNLNNLNKIKYPQAANPESVTAINKAMAAASKSGPAKHVFTPGQPGWNELIEGNKLFGLGERVKGSRPTSAKVKNWDGQDGEFTLGWK